MKGRAGGYTPPFRRMKGGWRFRPKRRANKNDTPVMEWWSEKYEPASARIYFLGISSVDGKRLYATLGWVVKTSAGKWSAFREDNWLRTVGSFHRDLNVDTSHTVGTFTLKREAQSALVEWWKTHSDRGGRVMWDGLEAKPYSQWWAEWVDSDARNVTLILRCPNEGVDGQGTIGVLGVVSIDGDGGDWYAAVCDGDDDWHTSPCGSFDAYQDAQQAIEHAWKNGPHWFPMRIVRNL